MSGYIKQIGLGFAIWLAVCGHSSVAQQRDTVFTTVATDYVGDTPDDFDLPAYASIGQIFHEWTVIFKDRDENTCDDPGQNLEAKVYGSPDGSRYFRIPGKILYRRGGVQGDPDTATNRFRVVVAGSSAKPYLRLNVSGWDDTNCLLDVYYAGTINPASDFNLGSQIGTGGGNVTDLENNVIVIAGTDTFDIADIDNIDIISVYGLILYNSGAVAHVALNAVDPDATPYNQLRLDALCDGCLLVLPITGHAYFRTPDALQDLQIDVICTGCTVTGAIQFRRE